MFLSSPRDLTSSTQKPIDWFQMTNSNSCNRSTPRVICLHAKYYIENQEKGYVYLLPIIRRNNTIIFINIQSLILISINTLKFRIFKYALTGLFWTGWLYLVDRSKMDRLARFLMQFFFFCWHFNIKKNTVFFFGYFMVFFWSIFKTGLCVLVYFLFIFYLFSNVHKWS